MQPGELRRFKDFKREWHLSKAYFMVLCVNESTEGDPRRRTGVDILIDGKTEANLKYFWVMNNSEALSEAG